MFQLRLPFRPLQGLRGLGGELALDVGCRRALLRPFDPYIALYLGDFDSASAAEAALPTAWGAVMVSSLDSGIGIRAETTLDHVAYVEDPAKAGANIAQAFGGGEASPVDGLVNGNLPAAVPSGKAIRFVTAGDATFSLTSHITRLVPILERALAAPMIDRAFLDERLRLSLELWADYHREASSRSKFLTLVMAIEVLTHPAPKHAVAQRILARWDNDLVAELENHDSATEEHEALQSLRRELLFRRDRSIRSRIRSQVRDVIGLVRPAEAEALAKLAVKAYDIRGTLVHDGCLSPGTLEEGHHAARESLRAIVLSSVGLADLQGET